jgi:hypothetical protein
MNPNEEPFDAEFFKNALFFPEDSEMQNVSQEEYVTHAKLKVELARASRNLSQMEESARVPRLEALIRKNTAFLVHRKFQILDLRKRIAKLEAENAYLDSIKDPLRDNIGWSQVSDLTFD